MKATHLATILLLCIALTWIGAEATRSSHRRSLLSTRNHRYNEGDNVPLFVNKVGPFRNPSETYQYYDLPFCEPKVMKHRPEYFGEILEGDRMVTSPYNVQFKVNMDAERLCTKSLDADQKSQFRNAVANEYYYQMIYDDLPIWGFVGKMESDLLDQQKLLILYTHVHFKIRYNGDQVIEVNVTTDPSRAIEVSGDEPIDVDFTYSATWEETDIPFEQRMNKYKRVSFRPELLEIHWFSILNSCVIVLILTAFLAGILVRVLKKDFAKFAGDDLDGEIDESGWKYIHGDVFRFPPNPSIFVAIIGSGTQILVQAFCIFLLSLVGVFYPYNRGALITALVVLYALTASIAGYVSVRLYTQMGGRNWVRNVLITASLFCGPLLLIFCFNNTVAIAYQTTAALPFGTIVVIIFIWALVTFPLTVLGGVIGKNSKAEFYAPCRTNKFAREVPPMPWYQNVILQMCMAGFLPFSAIFIELFHIFASVWGHKIYTIYSILFIVFILLIIVTAFVTIALTYFQLAVEDHRWWWRSIFCGGSTAFFVFAYCFYFYFFKSEMTGLMQTSFYFGYMAAVCYAFFLMLASVGFWASLLFVRSIYKAIKCE